MDTAPITKQPPPYSETVRPTLDDPRDATGNNWQQDHHPQYPSAPPISSFSYMPLTPPPTTTHNVTVVTAAAPQIMGGCPACRIGTMEKGFTCCGICCAICLFPIGILCCFCMRRMKCRNCGATL